jgi:hypothetical protein
MGFAPLRRLRQSGAHFTRACLTRYVALSGFLNLSALCFSRRLPALFHAGNALGVPPFRAFPPRPAEDTLSGPRALLPLAAAERLDSRALGQTRIRCRRDRISGDATTRCSPGLSSPSGSCLSRDGAPIEPLLSWPCSAATRRPATEWPPEYCSAGERVRLSRACRPSWGLAPLRRLHPHRNDRSSTPPATPSPRKRNSGIGLGDPCGRAGRGPSYVSATNPSDSHRPVTEHSKPAPAVKPYF